ncbi:MotA/TolQ/ExbB proton channel family protein [Sphingomonas gilva]|nr:MotA/TolQ/ExbB proton channel family protein [Sphingomonas gilva]
MLVDLQALLLVVGASLAVAAARASRGDIGRAVRAFGPLLSADPHADAARAMPMVRAIERVAHMQTLAVTDRVHTRHPVLAAAARALADCTDPEAYRVYAEETLADRARRHRGGYEFWAAAADAAPAMGLAGTVVGLIAMFANMAAPEAMGGGMALALVTTLYGVAFAHLVALPIARRLERLSLDELAWQRRAFDHLIALAERELRHPPAPRIRAVS